MDAVADSQAKIEQQDSDIQYLMQCKLDLENKINRHSNTQSRYSYQSNFNNHSQGPNGGYAYWTRKTLEWESKFNYNLSLKINMSYSTCGESREDWENYRPINNNLHMKIQKGDGTLRSQDWEVW